MNTSQLQHLILDKEDANILLDLLEERLDKEINEYDEEVGETEYMERVASLKDEVEDIYLFLK